MSAVPCTSGPPAPSPGAEDDIPATPDKGLGASLHPPIWRPALSRHASKPLGSEKPTHLSWTGYTAWPGCPQPPELP